MPRTARNWIGLASMVLLAVALVRGQEPVRLPELPRAGPQPEPEEIGLLFPQRPGAAAVASAVTVRWSGEAIEELGALVVITKGVLNLGVLVGDSLELRADSIEYDRGARSLRAAGDVLLRHPEFTLRCGRLEVAFKGSGEGAVPAGEAWDVTFEFPPSWTLKSAHVSFVSHPGDTLGVLGRIMAGGRATRTTVFRFDEASVTPCPSDGPGAPGWVARTSKLELKAGSHGPSGMKGYATLRNAVLLVKSVPVAWSPWLMYPARIDRSPGLLPPTLGYGSRLGATVGVSYFQPLGGSADVTLSPTWFANEGAMWGLEARWAPEETHGGSLSARFIRPRSSGEGRYQASLSEIWDTETGWLVRADVNQASDQMVEAEFGTTGPLPLGGSTYSSSLFVGKNFGRVALSLTASDQRTFFQTDDAFYRPEFPGSMQKVKLPEGQLRLYPVHLGWFYLDGSARLGQMGYSVDVREDGRKANYFWERGDCQVGLQGPLGHLGPFRASVQAEGRFTHYGAVLAGARFGSDGAGDPTDAPEFDPFRIEGPSAQRWLASSRLQLSAPQLGRSFPNLSLAGFRADLRHILEPTVAFTLNSKSGLAGAFPRFDETDTRPGVAGSAVGERSVELGLRQHIFARPGPGVAFADIVRLNAAISYYFDPIILADGRVRKGWGSLATNIDVEPSSTLRLSFRRSSERLGTAADTSVSADTSLGKKSLFSLAFFSSTVDQLQVRSSGLRVGAGHSLAGDRLRLRVESSYDLGRDTFAQSLISLSYVGRCVECGVRYQHIALPLVSPLAKEDRVDFTVSLKNIGELFSVEIGEAIADLFR